MLAAMYWGDDEEKRKKRLEQKLSDKKAKRAGEVPPPPVPPPPPPEEEKVIVQTVGDLETQELLTKQQEEIKDLKHLAVQQSKMLKMILEKQDKPTFEVISKPSAEEVRKILNVTATNGGVMLHRARLRLRSCLEKTWFESKDGKKQ